MTEAFTIAALWLALAVLATILANHLRISMALVEICVGIASGAEDAEISTDPGQRRPGPVHGKGLQIRRKIL